MRRLTDGFAWCWLGLCVGFVAGVPVGSGQWTLPDGGQIIDTITVNDHVDAWVMIVEESEKRSPATARILATDYASRLGDRKLHFAVYDVDEVSDPEVVRAAKAAGLPALIIVSKDGELLNASNQPPTAEAMDAVVKEKTGR